MWKIFEPAVKNLRTLLCLLDNKILQPYLYSAPNPYRNHFSVGGLHVRSRSSTPCYRANPFPASTARNSEFQYLSLTKGSPWPKSIAHVPIRPVVLLPFSTHHRFQTYLLQLETKLKKTLAPRNKMAYIYRALHIALAWVYY